MSTQQVYFHVAKPDRYSPMQLLLRLAAAALLGMLGQSFGLVFILLYVGLPAYAALRLQQDDGTAFAQDDAPRLTRALHWLASVYAWLGLIVDRLPKQEPSETVEFRVSSGPPPRDSGAALRRVLSGLPSLVILAIMNVAGLVVWLFAAVSVIFSRQIGRGTHRFLVALQRFAFGLLAYQAGLVDILPSFGVTEPSGHPS